MPITLVLGAARSGKSAFAEELVAASGAAPVYVATAEAGDAEMSRRIEDHRKRRGTGWRTVEAPIALADALAGEGAEGAAVLVDCLTLWLSNLMGAGMNIAAETARLEDALSAASAPIALVSNEVGAGIVPDSGLARAFQDAQGILNQRMAVLADDVVFLAAGLPLPLKRGGHPVHDLGI
jgi:adenosylcobinamide kinase/adenosylcobinamide-phosphate guanylyltransferase